MFSQHLVSIPGVFFVLVFQSDNLSLGIVPKIFLFIFCFSLVFKLQFRHALQDLVLSLVFIPLLTFCTMHICALYEVISVFWLNFSILCYSFFVTFSIISCGDKVSSMFLPSVFSLG